MHDRTYKTDEYPGRIFPSGYFVSGGSEGELVSCNKPVWSYYNITTFAQPIAS